LISDEKLMITAANMIAVGNSIPLVKNKKLLEIAETY